MRYTFQAASAICCLALLTGGMFRPSRPSHRRKRRTPMMTVLPLLARRKSQGGLSIRLPPRVAWSPSFTGTPREIRMASVWTMERKSDFQRVRVKSSQVLFLRTTGSRSKDGSMPGSRKSMPRRSRMKHPARRSMSIDHRQSLSRTRKDSSAKMDKKMEPLPAGVPVAQKTAVLPRMPYRGRENPADQNGIKRSGTQSNKPYPIGHSFTRLHSTVWPS